jgi:ADP-ribose pyrophosphatase YjhB (NUDIX family)
MLDGSIKAKAFAVILSADGSRHAVWRGTDATKTPKDFHRLLGGHIEFGEHAVDTVVREISEELGATLVDATLLGVLENVFSFEGRAGHEIVFVYGGRLAEDEVIPATGGVFFDNGQPIDVEWRPVADAGTPLPLYPSGADRLVVSWAGSSRGHPPAGADLVA